MSRPPAPSRRAILSACAALLGWTWRPGPSHGQTPPSDRGIGGTGAAPDVPDGDRGIGGTGVIGTIRRFGSIVVNDLRIAYPADAAVFVDGAPASAADLRVGQVVRTVATRDGNGLRTSRIDVTSEVVGRVEAVRGSSATVLGQTVSTASLADRTPLEVGQRVAVSGLRRTDGTIVASLVQPREAGPDRVAGPLRRTAEGLSIGGQALTGIDPALAGRRVVAEGALGTGGLQVARAVDERRLVTQGVRQLSIEGYVDRTPSGLRLGSGLPVEGRASLPRGAGGPAVMTTTVGRQGELRVDRVRTDRTASGPGRAETPGSGRAGPAGGRGNAPGGRSSDAGGRPGTRGGLSSGRPGGAERPGGAAPGSRGSPSPRDLPIDTRGPGDGGRGRGPGFPGGEPGGFPGSPGGRGGGPGGGFGGPGGGFGGPGRR